MGAEGAIDELAAARTSETSLAPPPAPVTSSNENASNRATRAVELAGRALDPTIPGGPDLELARLLLREAVVWAARAVAADASPSTLMESLEALADRGILKGIKGGPDHVRTELAILDEEPASKDVASVELLVASIVEAAAGKRRLSRHRRVRRWGTVALVVAAAIAVPTFGYFRFASDSYKYKVSTAHRGYPTEGFIGRIYAFGLVLHTQQQPEPWVEIDLEKTRPISRIVLWHRADCCHDRGLPMIVEIAGEDKAWEVVAERDKAFDRWTISLPGREARWIRIRSTANTVLHFREIQVR